MSMGYVPASAVVVVVEEVRKLNLHSFEALETYVAENNVSLYVLYMSALFDGPEEGATKEELKAIKLYNDFTKEFKENTGVSIELSYHDQEEEGSCYDGVNGYFFTLNETDLYKPTMKNEQLRKRIDFNYESWVKFG